MVDLLDYDVRFGQGFLFSPPRPVRAEALQGLAGDSKEAGKEGWIYLLNRENLGGYNTSTDKIVQELTWSVGNNGAWSTPAYWNGNVYYWGVNDHLKSFPLVNDLLSSTPTQSAEEYGYPGSTPSISANGSTQGIVWSVDSEFFSEPAPAILQAHSASNVAAMLYSSSTNTTRDAAGTAVKFAVPTVANGKVYIGTRGSDTTQGAGTTFGEIDVYGLLPN